MNTFIKGLKSVGYDEQIIYYDDRLLKDGIIIEEETSGFETGLDTIITVHHINKIGDIELDAASYTMYWSDYLEPIQAYRIIKDIYEFYNENPLSDFIEFLNSLSSSKISSSMQSKLEHSENVGNRIRAVFDQVKSSI